MNSPLALSFMLGSILTACSDGGRQAAERHDRSLGEQAGAPAQGIFAAVANDTSVRPPCAWYVLTPGGQQECHDSYPLDSMLRYGFGHFAPVPASISACRNPAAVDTLTFGEISVSRDGDYAGSEFVFQVVADSIRGYTREGEGGLSGLRTLQDLHPDAPRDGLRFWTTGGGRTKLEWRVNLSCVSLAGAFRFVNVPYGTDTGSVSDWYDVKLARTPSPYKPSR